MGSREKILEAIRQAKPVGTDYVPFKATDPGTANVLDNFIASMKAVGGMVSIVKDLTDLNKLISGLFMEGRFVANGCKELDGYNIEDIMHYSAEDLSTMETVVVNGSIGVAENGAVWITEGAIKNRLLPFICQHLVIVIRAGNIVADMHAAYERISISNEGYGVFIAGPSKTADIEQSLVVGAHGALSAHIFILV